MVKQDHSVTVAQFPLCVSANDCSIEHCLLRPVPDHYSKGSSASPVYTSYASQQTQWGIETYRRKLSMVKYIYKFSLQKAIIRKRDEVLR